MTRPDLLILGVQLESEGYPNVLHRVRALEKSERFNVTKVHYPAWAAATQDKSGGGRLLRNFWRTLAAHCGAFWGYLRHRRAAAVYVPYPGTLLLWLISFVPGSQQRIVVDVFISLYDTVVLDRRLVREGGVIARLLFWLERRALTAATLNIVDTPQTANHMATLFGLPPGKFQSIPLATDEDTFTEQCYNGGASTCRVLFVGTLIPLHGVETIAAAAELLAQRSDIELILIGDGQEAAAVERALAASPESLVWRREWLSSAELAREIAAADICLGIFGSTAKTKRVLPFKLYAYAGVGRCIITSATECSRDFAASVDYAPWAEVPTADPAALAATILALATDTGRRAELAANAARFYREKLSNADSLAQVEAALLSEAQ